ncbi:MAG: pyridoxamine 5-phosphate oxidase family protein [Solirubrobacterales bacterium]|nr:pyridoxamine 5-phosphate oxidase family protein [Solirubrobacterales bacterium]
MPGDLYHEGSRDLQDRFDTRRLADRLEQVTVRDELDDGDREFVAGCDMFFLATADAEGRPTCSYKGGDPGFVRVVDPRTIAFPDYDGNGMFRSMGNLLANPHVGLLFIRFDLRRRLRMEGVASIDPDDPLAAAFAGARFVVRVRAERVFPNCPRYIHEYRLVERSPFVPTEDVEPPVPAWKRRDWARDVLPAGDPARE